MKLGQIYDPSNGHQLIEVKNQSIYKVENKKKDLLTFLDFVRYSRESDVNLSELVEEKSCFSTIIIELG